MSLPLLRSDCSSCFGLCCVLLSFSREAGFGVTKPGGTPCHHLDGSDGCEIHATLREDGWPGCTVFECFGAGQQVSQVTYAGVSWREHDNLGEMAAVLSVMRQLHEARHSAVPHPVAGQRDAGRRTDDAARQGLAARPLALTRPARRASEKVDACGAHRMPGCSSSTRNGSSPTPTARGARRCSARSSPPCAGWLRSSAVE